MMLLIFVLMLKFSVGTTSAVMENVSMEAYITSALPLWTEYCHDLQFKFSYFLSHFFNPFIYACPVKFPSCVITCPILMCSICIDDPTCVSLLPACVSSLSLSVRLFSFPASVFIPPSCSGYLVLRPGVRFLSFLSFLDLLCSLLLL